MCPVHEARRFFPLSPQSLVESVSWGIPPHHSKEAGSMNDFPEMDEFDELQKELDALLDAPLPAALTEG
jgi:hypothetical protein